MGIRAFDAALRGIAVSILVKRVAKYLAEKS
jgi:hypothetical protein